MASINWPGIGSGDGTVQVTSTHELCVSDATARSLLTDIKTLLSNTDSGGLTDAQLRASPVSVSGTFWQATQPISGNVTVTQTTGSNLHTVIDSGILNISNFPAIQAVSQSGVWNLTNISGVVSLPTGASTSSKQPALGTAGSASTDVITVQGIASMTALKVDGSGVTQPVSGTFWQAAQPVTDNGGSLTVDGTVGISGTVPVSGTFWQATQPVSAISLPLPSGAATSVKQPALGIAGTASADVITVQGIASMTPLKTDGSATTQPVSGTFWQATQPVSIASMPVTPVTDNGGSLTVDGTVGISGTVPVSGTVTANAGSGTMAISAASLPLPTGASQDSTLTGGNQKAIIRGGAKGSTTAADVTSTAVDANTQALDISIKNSSLAVTQSGTWNIGSVTTLPALVAGSALIGKVGIDQTTPGTTNLVSASQSGTWTVQPGNTANTTAWLVTGTTLTKGTQGSTGFSTQDLKDAGRTNVSLTAEAVAGAASEALVTLTQSKAYAAATTGTSYNVTAGKTLRLASLAVTFISTTTANTSRIRVRVNPSGAAVIGSPIAWSLRLGWPTATFIANETNTFTISFPDGMEIPGSGGIAVTHTEAAANGTIDLSMTGFEY